MLLVFLAVLSGLGLVGVLLMRMSRNRRESSAWLEMALRYPSTTSDFEGARFIYPATGGEAIVGTRGIRVQPSVHLTPIEVPWSEVRAVRAVPAGGLRLHVHGGVVVLPGAASAAISDRIRDRARGLETA